MVELSYKGRDILNTNEPDIKEGETMKICFYIIDRTDNPFLEFLFFNDSDNLKFLQFKYQGNVPSKEGYNIVKNIFIKFDENIKYRGYIDNILFYEMVSTIENVSYKTKKEKLWFLLVDEIINKKSSLHMNVDRDIVSFFLRKPSLLFLVDKKKMILPSPIACYYGNYLDNAKTISVFGVQKASIYASQGPFYYFCNYNSSLRYSIWSHKQNLKIANNKQITEKNGKYKRGGIVRFAVFLGKSKFITNKNTDPKNNMNYTDNYDSVIYYKENDILYSIKKYYNQYPISYFSINTDNSDSIDDVYQIKIE